MADYLKIPEVARRLDVSEKTARRYVKAGTIPSVFVGGAYRVSEEDLAQYLQGARVEPEVEAPKALASEPWREQLRALNKEEKLNILEAAKAMKVFERADIGTAESDVTMNKLVDAFAGLESTAPDLSEKVRIMELVFESDLGELREFLLDEEGRPDPAVVLAFADVLRHRRSRGEITPEDEENGMNMLKRAVG